MAERRMFAKTIIDSDAFLDMHETYILTLTRDRNRYIIRQEV